jgi:hypothetical protein
LSSSKLLNPAAVVARQQAHQQKEVLQPPAVFAYCDKSAAPHFLQTTGNRKVGNCSDGRCTLAVRAAHTSLY